MPILRRLPLCAVVATLVATLAGCASTAPSLVSVPTTAASVSAYRDNIELSGRLSVSYEKAGQPDSVSGSFQWVQQAGRIDVTLSSPLGQTIATINVSAEGATLTQSGRAPLHAPDLDTLTADALGWSLPVASLRDWLQGYATDSAGQRFAVTAAQNEVNTQDGWRLRFVSWQSGQGGAMPRRIDASRSASATAGALAIRIVLEPSA